MKPIKCQIEVSSSDTQIKRAIIATVKTLGGVAEQSGECFEIRLGSLLKSRLLGEFWVSRSTLPKIVRISIGGSEAGHTCVTLDVASAHKFGIKLGYKKKYALALQEVSDVFINAIRSSSSS